MQHLSAYFNNRGNPGVLAKALVELTGTRGEKCCVKKGSLTFHLFNNVSVARVMIQGHRCHQSLAVGLQTELERVELAPRPLS